MNDPITSNADELSTAIRAHHRALAKTLDDYARDLDASANDLDAATLSESLNGLTSFLAEELLTHARGEEQALYPVIDPIIRAHGSPTATMRIDHEYIATYARDITDTARSLRSAGASDRAALSRQLARQLLQLQTLFGVHLAKEERVYLPLINQAISSGDQQALLKALHAEAAEADTAVDEESDAAETAGAALDVRHLPPPQRHPVIFERFNALPVEGSFMLVNDHDPKPLYYQLSAEYDGQLLWQYLEQGPEVWRVRIGKAS